MTKVKGRCDKKLFLLFGEMWYLFYFRISCRVRENILQGFFLIFSSVFLSLSFIFFVDWGTMFEIPFT